MTRLLTEKMNFDEARCVLEEGDAPAPGKPKDLYMRGIFVQGGTKNHNQRVYPVSEIRQAVDSINETLRRGESVLGEADHPEELNINIDRVSHMITEMYMDGPNGMGKLKILPTPMGNIVRTLLENQVKLGVSSRGSGSVNDGGEVSDFEIVTVDVVVRPSAPEAYPQAVYEALNRRRGPVIQDLAQSVVNDAKAQKFLKEELLRWVQGLK